MCRWKCKLIAITSCTCCSSVKLCMEYVYVQQWVIGSIVIRHSAWQSSKIVFHDAVGEMEHLSNWPRRNYNRYSPFEKLCKCGHDSADGAQWTEISVRNELWIYDLFYSSASDRVFVEFRHFQSSLHFQKVTNWRRYFNFSTGKKMNKSIWSRLASEVWHDIWMQSIRVSMFCIHRRMIDVHVHRLHRDFRTT